MMFGLVLKFFEHRSDGHFSLGHRDPATPYKLHDPKEFQLKIHLVYFMPPPGFGQHKEFPAHRYDLTVAFFDNILDLPFVEQEVGGNFKKGGFLVNGLLVCVVKGLDHLHLLFDLGDDTPCP